MTTNLPSDLPSDRPARPIRSYVLRAGRMGPGQQRALDELGPRYLLPFEHALLDYTAVFGRTAPTVLEIGFGMGDATAAIGLRQGLRRHGAAQAQATQHHSVKRQTKVHALPPTPSNDGTIFAGPRRPNGLK